MKKLVIICFIFVFLCSCSNERANFLPITDSLSFNAKINDEEMQYFVKIENKETYIEADEVSLNFKGDSASIRLDKLEYKTEISALPEGIYIDFIHSVFLDASKKQTEILSRNDKFYLEGETKRYSYKIYFGSSGLPIKITDSKNNISVIILNAKVLWTSAFFIEII